MTTLGVLGGRWDGMDIRRSPVLPMPSSDAMDARRIVRHGLADVLRWLGEDVGPRPGEPVHAVQVHSTLWVSDDLWADMVGLAVTPSVEEIARRRWGC